MGGRLVTALAKCIVQVEERTEDGNPKNEKPLREQHLEKQEGMAHVDEKRASPSTKRVIHCRRMVARKLRCDWG